MSKLFNNISDADKKMLTKIYWRSFAVFAGPCGAAYRQAPGFTMSIMPALERYYPEQEKRADITELTEKEWRRYRTFGIGGSDAAAYDAVQYYPECRYFCDGIGRFNGT